MNTTISFPYNKRNTGFHSGCGYEYQRYAFLWACTKLKKDNYVTFERIEDIEFGTVSTDSLHIIIQVKEVGSSIQLKELLPEIEKAWQYLIDSEKTTNFWYITTQSVKLETPPLCANSPQKSGIEIWNNPANKQEFQALINFLSQTTSQSLKDFLKREQNTPNAIRDSLVSNITFWDKTPYLEELNRKIEASLTNFLEQNGYQYPNISALAAVLKREIDILMDNVHKGHGKEFKLFYSDFQNLVRKNINLPNSYTQTNIDDSTSINIGNRSFGNRLVETIQNLFKNEQKIVDAVKKLDTTASAEEYCQELAGLLLEVIQIRTHKTLNTHLKSINDVNQQEYSCFVFANQLIFDLQKGNMDRGVAEKQAIKLITQLQIFYNRSE